MATEYVFDGRTEEEIPALKRSHILRLTIPCKDGAEEDHRTSHDLSGHQT